jgi:hypothetical protein
MRRTLSRPLLVGALAVPTIGLAAALGLSVALAAAGVVVLAAIVLAVAGLALLPRVAFAWDDSRVHPWITQQALRLLKDHHYASYLEAIYVTENPGGDEGRIGRIASAVGMPGTSTMAGDLPVVYGSIVEDNPATNGQYHFYNPKAQVRDGTGARGLGLNSGWSLPDAQSTLGGVGKLLWNVLTPKSLEYPTTPYSAVDRAAQDSVGLDDEESHHTWRWAEDFYRRGDWVRSYTVLGRVCHLLADMAVPAHVRNDNHLGQYAANFVDNPLEYANGLVFGTSRYEGLFPQATYDVLQKGMEPFESYTYGLVLQGRAPTTSEPPIMRPNWLAFFRDLAMRTHTSWYSENTIPGNDTIPGRSVDEDDFPDESRCTPIAQAPGKLSQDESTGDKAKDAIKTVGPILVSPGWGLGAAVIKQGWKRGSLRDRFTNVLNGDDYRSPKGVGRPYTLTPKNHQDCANDVMPIAIRYLAGLIQRFYEDRERLKVEIERGEKKEPWGTPIEYELQIENRGAILEDLEVRLDGLDGIACPEADRPDWTLELAVADEQEEPHASAQVAVVDAKRHVWKVTYPQGGAKRLQAAAGGDEFAPEPLLLTLRAYPPGVRAAVSGGAR